MSRIHLLSFLLAVIIVSPSLSKMVRKRQENQISSVINECPGENILKMLTPLKFQTMKELNKDIQFRVEVEGVSAQIQCGQLRIISSNCIYSENKCTCDEGKQILLKSLTRESCEHQIEQGEVVELTQPNFLTNTSQQDYTMKGYYADTNEVVFCFNQTIQY